MNELKQLVEAYCPKGVPFIPLGLLLKYEQPGKYLVDSTAYDDSYITPVLTAGQTFVLGYTNETAGVYPASKEKPVLIFDDFTTAFKWVDFPFKAKSSAMKMLTLKPEVPVELRYIFLAMQSLTYRPRDHARQWIGTFSDLRVPVPPVEVQAEIVRILDHFGEVSEALQKELLNERDTRMQQFEHCRSIIRRRVDSYDHVPLLEVADFFNAKAHEKFVDPTGSVALLTSRFISTNGHSARYVHPEDVHSPALRDDVALVMSDLPNGRALARTFYVDADAKYAANQRVCLLRSRDHQVMAPRFLSHMLDRNPRLLAYDNGADQTHLKKGYIEDLSIGVPPIEEQLRLTSLLDNMNALFREMLDLTIPAEIEVRRRQYEFYRAKLLTFEETTA